MEEVDVGIALKPTQCARCPQPQRHQVLEFPSADQWSPGTKMVAEEYESVQKWFGVLNTASDW